MKSWRPSSGPAAASRRANLLRRLRDYFDASDTLEVETPALSPYAVSDPHIESLTVQSRLHEAPLYLHTSPEFHMKRLLAAGYPDIYSICRVFRDGEAGKCHQPEFTMVEWYRLGFSLQEIVTDTVKAIAAALDAPQLLRSINVVDYRDAFCAAAGVDPITASTCELADAAQADSDLRTAIGKRRDDWLNLMLSTTVVATFADDRITVLQHFPASQAALARQCPADAALADRFEIFIGAIELANGYVELTDADEQARRFASDQAEREVRGRVLRPRDDMLLSALKFGLPQCAGVAMGLERLQMLHDKADDIRDVVTFTFAGDDA